MAVRARAMAHIQQDAITIGAAQAAAQISAQLASGQISQLHQGVSIDTSTGQRSGIHGSTGQTIVTTED